jgi:D-amino peptidase
MKIYIMTDLEGSAGILNFADYAAPGNRCYDLACELVTEEVNAAIAGLSEAGAKEFLVVDGHGHGAMNQMLLDPRAELLASTQAGYPFGCDESFDAAIMIGQHAKSNTDGGHLCHTGSFVVEELAINGVSMGEAGQNMLFTGYFGVPTIFLAGDEACCREVEALAPKMTTVAVKRGAQRGSASGLTGEEASRFNLQAIHVHPSVARERIRKGARKALRRLKKVPPLRLDPPYTFSCTLRATEDARPSRATGRNKDLLELLKQPRQYKTIVRRKKR